MRPPLAMVAESSLKVSIGSFSAPIFRVSAANHEFFRSGEFGSIASWIMPMYSACSVSAAQSSGLVIVCLNPPGCNVG